MKRCVNLVAWITSVWILLNIFPSSFAVAEATGALNVATYNVESPRFCSGENQSETRPEVVADHIRALAGPDLWALSEVPGRDAAEVYRDAAGSNFELILGTQGTCFDKLAILFNRDRLSLVSEPQQLITEVGGDRDPLVARFRIDENGTEFFAVANHFARGNTASRNAQAANLREWIEGQTLPVVAMGDFNMDFSVDIAMDRPGDCNGFLELGNEAFNIFTRSEGMRWIQPGCLASGTCPPEGTGCFLPCFNSILDFVFVGGPGAQGWTGTSTIAFPDDPDYCANDPLGDTDHRPVLATLTYPIGVVPPPPPLPLDLRITELFPNPVGGSSVEIESETVTIANFGSRPVDLSGWSLQDRANTAWSLFGTLQPNQRLEFHRNGQPMALNNNGDTIVLIDPSGAVVDTVTYLSTTEGQAIIFSTLT